MAGQLILSPGPMVLGYVISGAVAGLIGGADIIGRYRDNPWGALFTWPASGYVLVNLVFGVAAFWLSVVLGLVNIGVVPATGDRITVDLVKAALLVGLGATFILRSVAFKISIGGKTSDVGPSTIVDSLLRASDQEIDRAVARRKDRQIRGLMKDVSFEKSKAFIPTYCLALLQQDEPRAKRLGELVAAIEDFKQGDAGADAQRAFLLGNTLINIFGYEVAKGVIAGFKGEVHDP